MHFEWSTNIRFWSKESNYHEYLLTIRLGDLSASCVTNPWDAIVKVRKCDKVIADMVKLVSYHGYVLTIL